MTAKSRHVVSFFSAIAPLFPYSPFDLIWVGTWICPQKTFPYAEVCRDRRV